MSDYSTQQVANIALPLPSPGTNTLLQDADPVLFYALDFWASMIRKYVGPRLVSAAANVNILFSDPVAAQAPYDPAPYLQQQGMAFPALFAFRKTTEHTRKTIGWEHDRTVFCVQYVLPTLTSGQAAVLLPVFNAVKSVLRKLTTQGFDPDYTPPGGTIGQQPWTLSLAGLEEIGFTTSSEGYLAGMGNLLFPCLEMIAYAQERDMLVPAATAGRTKFAGGDISVSITDANQTSVPNLVQASTQQAPSVSVVAPNNASLAGGTSLVVTGANFLSGGCKVYVGPAPCSNVVVSSSTILTCTTPPAPLGLTGPFSLTVANRDGQSGTLPNAFTYTSP